jgi:hypothetical protein
MEGALSPQTIVKNRRREAKRTADNCRYHPQGERSKTWVLEHGGEHCR